MIITHMEKKMKVMEKKQMLQQKSEDDWGGDDPDVCDMEM